MRFALLLVVASLSIAGSGQAAEIQRWSLHVGALGGLPTSPSEFRDSWGFAWGLEGGFTRSLGGRWALGFDGRYQQFGFDGEVPEGADVLGGARRFGIASLRLDAELYRAPRRAADRVVVELGAGYVHQSIEPLSGIAPLSVESADGFSGSAGLVYSRQLYADTRLLLGLRHTWFVLPDETLGSFEMRLGATVPLGTD